MVCAVVVAAALVTLAACKAEPEVSPTTSSPGVSQSPSSSSATPRPSTTPPPVVPTTAPSSSPTAPSGSVEVTVITAGLESDGIEVSGIVTSVTDASAVCTLTATSGGVVRTAEATVTPNGGNSYCPVLVIPRDQLSAGSWSVTLSYRGSPGEGASAPVTIEVT